MDYETQPQSLPEQAFNMAKSWLQDSSKLEAIKAGIQAYVGTEPSALNAEISQLPNLNTKKLADMKPGEGILYMLWGTLSAKLERGENVSNLQPAEITQLVTDAYHTSAASSY